MTELRILLIGGGSGGHTYPLVAVARSLQNQASTKNIRLKLLMLGEGNFIKMAANESEIPYKRILAGKLRRYISIATFFDLFKIPLGFIQSLWYIFLFMPDAVFSKGGYGSVAPAIVARLFFIPVFVHESDSIPGLANKIIGNMASTVFLSFKTAERYFKSSKVIFSGNPTRVFREDINAAREYFDLHEVRPTILVLGGSQGAKIINETITSGLVVMAQKFNIIHQCGESQYPSVHSAVETILKEGAQQYSSPIKAYYRYYPYFNENQLNLAFSIADVIISRAGAAFLFEIAQLGKPAIIIPITQSSSNHQYMNAFEFSLFGGYLMEEANLNRESLLRELDILLNPEQYARISERIKTFATPLAANIISETIFKTLKI
ncbi:MAG: UDP-N-acetylglucosamine--N-acetylmuramyl-(pentapeptide) pyrophosphoryl-undecaprenol N-acetylglucosamine transferase [Candidatus Yanofskybacteria bacterium]|nr:UDP-N-acetylglucosamine--N-acetylmuramyl-(pentapeptide) pyrophosphoryl-undecaprenol N-acetylglucosamine transferase [Candidatus Yanofskybacteria bacterium]